MPAAVDPQADRVAAPRGGPVRLRPTGAPSRRAALLLGTCLACVLVCLPTCGPESTGDVEDAPASGIDTGVEARAPGDSIFDALLRMSLLGTPPTNLPPDIGKALGQQFATVGETIPADAWLPAESAAPAVEGRASWRCLPRLRLDLAVGTPWLRHEGRVLVPLAEGSKRTEREATLLSAWRDAEADIDFSWDTQDGSLHAAGARAPAALTIGYRADPLTALAHFERPADRAGVAGLACRHALVGIDRPCLWVPAPTTLALPVADLRADTLEVATAVLDLGLDLEHGRAVRAEGLGDGVTFAVEVEIDGRRERVWQQHVQPGGAFDEHDVDLSAWLGRSFTLRLLTEPGPAGDASFDYALWSGLRLRGPPRQPPTRPHVIVIDVDTLRADRLSCYGNPRPTTPRLDAWAERAAVVYTDCTSAGDWTLTSTASLLTGLAVSQHGVLDYPQALGADLEPIAQRLRRAGYETLAHTDGGFVDASFGFQHGFDRFEGRKWTGPDEQRWDDDLARLARRRSEHPVFLFLQTYQVHAPYRDDRRFADPDYAGPYADKPMGRPVLTRLLAQGAPLPDAADWAFIDACYDAGVRRMDDLLGSFLERLDEALHGEPALIVFTSDHGEELAERGFFGHGHSLHRELVAVPLIVQHPPGGPVGRVDAPTSGLDLVPTILDYAGLPIPEYLSGLSLRGTPPSPRLVRAEHHDPHGDATAVQWSGWKLFLGAVGGYGGPTDYPDLYHVGDDPGERRELAGEQERVVERLRRLAQDLVLEYPPLERGHDASRGEQAVADDARRDLRALGYLGGDG